jgi:multimeric flavodoxin WrbA
MVKVLAINGSPRKEKGNTAMILGPFLEGLTEAGAEVKLFYASRLKLKPCACGGMQCWYKHPGECSIKDDMEQLYPELRAAEILVLATPVYIPIPANMQNVINRLCPLAVPLLEFRHGRTRARFRDDVNIKKIVAVSSGGWWEKENMDTVVRIVHELAEVASVEFSGAVLRPHAFMMKADGEITLQGEEIQDAARTAGRELIQHGEMDQATLELISRPLITEEELRARYNQMVPA